MTRKCPSCEDKKKKIYTVLVNRLYRRWICDY